MSKSRLRAFGHGDVRLFLALLFAAWLLAAGSAGAAMASDSADDEMQPPDTSIIFQMDFENATPGKLPSGWAGQGKVVDTGAYAGNLCLQVDDTSTTTYGGVNAPLVPVQPNHTYLVQIAGKSDVADRAGDVGLFIYEVKADGKNGQAHGMWFPKTAEWEITTITIKTAPDTVNLRPIFYSAARGVAATGSAWFDSVIIKYIDPTMEYKKASDLKDAFARTIPVTEREDIVAPMTPEEFWQRVPVFERVANPPILSYSLMRRAYFDINLNIPKQALDTLELTPKMSGMLGKVRRPTDPVNIVATDIPYSPIMRAHPAATGSYSNKYYPRRMQDWINGELHPAYVLTGDGRFSDRMLEMLDYLLFSQYGPEGENEFTSTFFPTEYAAAQAQGLTKQWAGGWDYLFDWEWNDAYGYTWHLHEPDHHVNSQIAVAMVRGYELTGETKYLEAAAQFVYNQIPRYGWHTGIWNGQRYYWTEYNPSGPTNPTEDATDNVMGLVAQAVAMVGYYKQDARLLEYARGLLWYLVREYTTDGRWYYDGAENPLNYRRAESHELVCLDTALKTLPYLIKAGVDVAAMLPVLDEAYERYQGLSAGKAYKMAFKVSDGAQIWRFSTYFQAGTAGAAAIRFSDYLPPAASGFAEADEYLVRATKLLPPGTHSNNWVGDSQADVVYRVTKNELERGINLPFSLQPYDILRVSYEVVREGGQGQEVEDGRSVSVGGSSISINLTPSSTGTTTKINLSQVIRAQTIPSPFSLAVPEPYFLTLPARMYFPFADEVEAGVELGAEPPAMRP